MRLVLIWRPLPWKETGILKYWSISLRWNQNTNPWLPPSTVSFLNIPLANKSLQEIKKLFPLAQKLNQNIKKVSSSQGQWIYFLIITALDCSDMWIYSRLHTRHSCVSSHCGTLSLTAQHVPQTVISSLKPYVCAWLSVFVHECVYVVILQDGTHCETVVDILCAGLCNAGIWQVHLIEDKGLQKEGGVGREKRRKSQEEHREIEGTEGNKRMRLWTTISTLGLT